MTVFPRRAVLAAALALAVSGCATLPPDAGDDDVQSLLSQRQGARLDWRSAAESDTDEPDRASALASPMDLDGAIRLAMLHSPRLRLEYARLGLARAEVMEALQVGNPRLSLSRESLEPGGGHQRFAGLAVPLADLLALPLRTRLAQAEFGRGKLDIAAAVLGVVADVEVAWYRYLAARQIAELRTAVAEGSQAAADLAQRFHEAGNISRLQLSQEQAVASQARIDAARAQARLVRAKLALDTQLGLTGALADWSTRQQLPLPVPREDSVEDLLALAALNHLPLQAARQRAGLQAQAVAGSRRLRWLGGSEIGYGQEREADGTRVRGPSLALELPLFNQGQARVARAEALLAQAQARVAQAEITVDNDIRQGARQVQALRDVVEIHGQSLLPQRQRIVDDSQREQNYMLIGVFELVQAKVKEYDAHEAYLLAIRDYWVARANLSRAVGQRLPSDALMPDAGVPSLPGDGSAAPHGHDGMDHGGMDHEGMDHEGMDHKENDPHGDHR
ncbi:TolC family protein [Arenimonas sp. MALMAid1274]|uniref:TolC family protein n=1 Tax=Arenimonas sp. MALMAid1274 TaxID=3411630 RepID=UPI003BA155C9